MIPGEDAALEIIREGHPDVYEKPIWLINSKGGCIVCIPFLKLWCLKFQREIDEMLKVRLCSEMFKVG